MATHLLLGVTACNLLSSLFFCSKRKYKKNVPFVLYICIFVYLYKYVCFFKAHANTWFCCTCPCDFFVLTTAIGKLHNSTLLLALVFTQKKNNTQLTTCTNKNCAKHSFLRDKALMLPNVWGIRGLTRVLPCTPLRGTHFPHTKPGPQLATGFYCTFQFRKKLAFDNDKTTRWHQRIKRSYCGKAGFAHPEVANGGPRFTSQYPSLGRLAKSAKTAKKECKNKHFL